MKRAAAVLGGVGLALVLAAGPSLAQSRPAYTAAEIERHFDRGLDLGPSRALCIGTQSECAKAVPERPKAGGFDLVVTFDYNSDVLTPPAKANLDEFSKAIQGALLHDDAFMVEGHTDAKGSEPYNNELSKRRAEAVVRYLAGQGVDRARLEAKGYGKSHPRAADPADPSNRRVETRLRAP